MGWVGKSQGFRNIGREVLRGEGGGTVVKVKRISMWKFEVK